MAGLVNSFWGAGGVLPDWNDISGMSYDTKSYYAGAEGETVPRGLEISADGTKAYTVGFVQEDVFQYTLSTPFDISTASYASKFKNVTAETGSPSCVRFKPDGTIMYVGGTTSGGKIWQYTLSTAWDVSTASYASKSFLMSLATFLSFNISPDGLVVFGLAYANKIEQRTMAVAWDISTCGLVDDLFLFTPLATVEDMMVNPNGKQLYLTDLDATKIYQYSLSTAWDLTTISSDGVDYDYSAVSSDIWSMTFKLDGSKVYLATNGLSTIYQYSL